MREPGAVLALVDAEPLEAAVQILGQAPWPRRRRSLRTSMPTLRVSR